MKGFIKPIVIDSSLLKTDRKKSIIKVISPMLETVHKAQVLQIGPGIRSFTLGALPRGSFPILSMNPEDPRVPTKIGRLFFNYHETWIPTDSGNEYLLDRAYLHIHLQKLREDQSKQVLSLHCDPCLSSSAEHYRYKRGPHIHVEGANPSLDHAHVSLCLGDKQLGGDNLNEITNVFMDSVKMIKDELFPCWERAISN